MITALLAVLLIVAVFGAVHGAEVVAHRIGEPFGALVLAVSVTVIEVALIVSVMLSDREGGALTLARDTVFAAVMLVLNGIVGLCVLLGGVKHVRQDFRMQGALGGLAAIATLVTLTLVLPNTTSTTLGPVYSTSQLAFAGAVSLLLYCVYVFVQTVSHKEDFVSQGGTVALHARPGGRTAVLNGVLLVVCLVAVVALAKLLSPALEAAVSGAGLPRAVVGIVIAALVLLPEALTAVRAARADNLQTSLNLALGSAIASIGLTIPAVAVVAIMFGMKLELGLGLKEMVLLTLSLLVSVMTLGTGQTTVLQGAIHLTILASFLFLAAVP